MAENYCGTGFSIYTPKPGDPSGNVVVRAEGVVLGIKVSWTLPSVNTTAVSFVKVYRAEEADFNKSSQIAQVASDNFLDPVPDFKTYFYWIKILSLSGTLSEAYGYASAVKGRADIGDFTSKVGMTELDKDLSDRIKFLGLVRPDIDKEILDRLARDKTLQDALSRVETANGEAATNIYNETIERKSAVEALVSSIKTLSASLASARGAITEEATLRMTEDTAIGTVIKNNYVQVGKDITSAIRTYDETIVDQKGFKAEATKIYDQISTVKRQGEIYTSSAISDYRKTFSDLSGAYLTAGMDAQLRVGTVSSKFSDFYSGYVSTTGSLSQKISTLEQSDKNLSSQIVSLSQSSTNASGALSQKIDQVLLSAYAKTASVQQTIEAKYDSQLNQLTSKYYVSVDNDGYVGGFGLINNSKNITARFDVDKFSIGRPYQSASESYPFELADGKVYIRNATIKNAAIDSLKIANGAVGAIQHSSSGGSSVSIEYNLSNLPPYETVRIGVIGVFTNGLGSGRRDSNGVYTFNARWRIEGRGAAIGNTAYQSPIEGTIGTIITSYAFVPGNWYDRTFKAILSSDNMPAGAQCSCDILVTIFKR